ncbi:MAG: PAS domain-containing sensor histidine kinase, partial [Anaerolineales bacterium]
MGEDDNSENFANASHDADNHLRQRAENLLRQQPEGLRETSMTDAKQLIHDLQVHQIELEMQNDELLRTRRTLEVVQSRFRDLYDYAPVGYLTLNVNGIIQQANLTLVTMLGVDRYSLVNQPFSRFILREDQDNYYFQRRKLFETREPQVYELRLVRKDGSQFWARLDAVIVQGSEDQTLCRVIISDISEQVRIHDRLKISEEKYRNFADRALVGVYQTTHEGTFLYANKALTEMLGFASPAEILTENITDRYQEAGERLALLTQLQEKGSVDRYELKILTHTGLTKYVTVSAYLEGDNIQGMMVDITERKQADKIMLVYSEKLEETVTVRTQELQDLHEQLIRQEKLAVLGQLAGGVGHELRTPLNAIKIATYYLNMILPEKNPDPEIQETLKVLERETAIAERIITSLLDYARTRLPNWHTVNLNDLLQDVMSRTPLPDAPRVEVDLQLDPELPMITADPDQLPQIFNNLVLNAVQAMPEGGQLTIRTERENPEWVKVSITDTGTGIPEKNLERLFLPLFTTKTQGMGLGLTIVKN